MKKLNTYTPELREKAVKLVLTQGLTIDEAALRLTIPKGTLGNWVSAARRCTDPKTPPGCRSVAELEADVTKLKKLLQLDNPKWGISVPLPHERAITHEPRPELIQEVNPAYLSYWNPDGVGRAFYFWASALIGLVTSSVMAFSFLSSVLGRGYVTKGEPIGAVDIGLIIFAASLPILSAVLTYLSVRLPLRPPTYLSRTLRRVYAWHGNKKIDSGWMYIDWDNVIPVTRRTQIFHSSGSSTLYVLQLLEVDPGTKAILKTVVVFNPQRDPELCGEMWEYIRRYMNGGPENLPPARIDWRIGGFFGLVIRLHEMAFELWMRPDGTLRLGPISFFFAPLMVAGTYFYIGIGVWLEHIIPKQSVPAELEQANCWVGKNPYPIYEGSPEEQARLKVRAMKIFPIDLVLMLISILFHSSIIVLLLFAAWF
jgi:transposase